MATTNEAFKAWIDAMPIDDVHRKTERLERKLSDLRILERLYAERQTSGEPASEATDPEASSDEETPPEPHSNRDPSQAGPDEPT